MIRFGVVLSVVLIAIGLLVTGVVAGSLLLVVISIGVALLAFLVLIGVVISFRHEIFGRTPIGVPAAGTSLAAPARAGRPAGPRLAARACHCGCTDRPGDRQQAGPRLASRTGRARNLRPARAASGGRR